MSSVRRAPLSTPLLVPITLALSQAASGADPDQLARLNETLARQAARATAGFSNLHKIGLAMHGYHDIFGRFPPAALTGPDGETKYSWRVELLPVLKYYVDGAKPDRLREFTPAMSRAEMRSLYWALLEESGYRVYDAWDSPHNEKLLTQAPQVYLHPNDKPDSIYTRYFALTGATTIFSGPQGTTLRDIIDGTSLTLMLVEADRQIPWTLPEDIDYAVDHPRPELGLPGSLGFLILKCDGDVNFLPHDFPESDFQALLTPAGGDAISIPWIPYRYKATRR